MTAEIAVRGQDDCRNADLGVSQESGQDFVQLALLRNGIVAPTLPR